MRLTVEPVGSGLSPVKSPTNIKNEVATGTGSLVVGVRADFSGVIFPPVCGCKRDVEDQLVGRTVQG